MTTAPQPGLDTAPYAPAARLSFAAGMIGLGALALVYGDFALQWQPVPAWVLWREALAIASGVLMLGCGAALVVRRGTSFAAALLFAFVIAWWLLLKVPRVIAAPAVEQSWLGCGEIGVLLAGTWVLFARLARVRTPRLRFITGDDGARAARALFGIALLPIGLSHFVYAAQTAQLVPACLPARTAWAYATGAGHIAAGLGVLFGVLPRLAAWMESGMLGAFTLLVWVPAILAAPGSRLSGAAFTISWAVAAAAWVVAVATPEYRRALRAS